MEEKSDNVHKEQTKALSPQSDSQDASCSCHETIEMLFMCKTD